MEWIREEQSLLKDRVAAVKMGKDAEIAAMRQYEADVDAVQDWT